MGKINVDFVSSLGQLRAACLETEDRLHYGPFVCCIIGPTIGPVKFMILTGTRWQGEGGGGERGGRAKECNGKLPRAEGKGEVGAG